MSSSSSDPSLETVAPRAAVTSERKLNPDLQEQVPKPCTYISLSPPSTWSGLRMFQRSVGIPLPISRSLWCSLTDGVTTKAPPSNKKRAVGDPSSLLPLSLHWLSLKIVLFLVIVAVSSLVSLKNVLFLVK
jgi:hypothetical protein